MIRTYRIILRLISPEQRRRFWLLAALMLVVGALDLAGVAMILPFLAVLANPDIVATNVVLARAQALTGAETTDQFLRILGVATFLLVMTGIATRAMAFYLANLFARQSHMVLGMARLRAYLSQPYEWFLRQHSADLSKSVLQEINEIVNGSVAPALRVIGNVFLMVSLAGFLLIVEPLGAVGIGLIFGVGFWLIDRAARRRIREMGVDRRLANRERHQVTGEALSGIKEVKMLGLESAYLQRFFDPSHRLASHQARLSLLGEMPRFALEALTFGGMLLFTLWLLWTNNGSLEEIVPILGAFAFAGLRLMPTVQVLFRDLSLMRFGQAALEGLEADLTTLSVSEEAERSDVAPPEFVSELRLDTVSYAYPGSSDPALHGIDLTIQAGTTVGFVGATGSGKSTVIDLILGLIPPSSGRILVDGVPIETENRRAWQRSVGFVPQSIYLVDDSVAANIAYGVPKEEIDFARVERAARMASAAEFIEALPERYDTFVGDKGIRLSGGQRQRLGIARALYRDQRILVFDEATSALDSVTENDVLAAVRYLHGEKTLVLVSHRLKTLACCDQIFVLRQGRLVASGTYAELSTADTDFRAMLEAAE